MYLSRYYGVALEFAHEFHVNQLRKGSTVAYTSHLIAVSSLVLEDNGTEDEAIAGLLHDAIEDQPQKNPEYHIQRLFGDNVLEIVKGCTDSWQTPKLPWRERKEAHLKKLMSASESVLRVSIADKLHNLRCTNTDLNCTHDKDLVWAKFSASKQELGWYYTQLRDIFFSRLPSSRHLIELDLCIALIDFDELNVLTP
jgi:(p)ppGpp synthase/HD superfamily hydrolase